MTVTEHLNGFDIPHSLLALMLRPDWAGRRTSDAWLRRFHNPPSGFVEFCILDQLVRENANVRNSNLAILCGAPNVLDPPGNFDPEHGFLIGFVEYVDDTICVDFRAAFAPQIIFYNAHSHGFSTAFDTIDKFCAFYKEQHGE